MLVYISFLLLSLRNVVHTNSETILSCILGGGNSACLGCKIKQVLQVVREITSQGERNLKLSLNVLRAFDKK